MFLPKVSTLQSMASISASWASFSGARCSFWRHQAVMLLLESPEAETEAEAEAKQVPVVASSAEQVGASFTGAAMKEGRKFLKNHSTSDLIQIHVRNMVIKLSHFKTKK